MAPNRTTAVSSASRVAGAASGVASATLCVTAVKILTGANSSGGSNSPKQTTAGVLGWTGGTVIVAALGAILIGVALFQGYKGISKKFLDDSKTRDMSRRVKRGFTAIGVFGHLGSVSSGTSHGWLFSASSATASSKLRWTTTRAARSASTEPSTSCSTTPTDRSSWASSAGLIGFALYSIADARYGKI